MQVEADPSGRPDTSYLDRPDGRIAYDVTGDGPLIVCVPGMGDLRSIFRFLTPALAAAGHRVATFDLRGHGDSDTSFTTYGDDDAGRDALALVEYLGGPAVLIGGSMGAGAAVWAAAEHPGAVTDLVLLGPFVRDPEVGATARMALNLALRRPWGIRLWSSYYASLYPTAPPDDLAAHQAAIRSSLRRPGAWRAFVETTHAGHAPAEARLGDVSARTLVVMGTRDPDFPDPAAEATVIADHLDAEVALIADAGHFPHAEFPDRVGPAVLGFLDRSMSRA